MMRVLVQCKLWKEEVYWCISTHVIRNYKENISCAGGAKVFLGICFLAQKKRTHSWGGNESCNIYKRSKWIEDFSWLLLSNAFLKIALHLIIQVRFTCQSYARVSTIQIARIYILFWFTPLIWWLYYTFFCRGRQATNWCCDELSLYGINQLTLRRIVVAMATANWILAALWVWRYYMPFP